MPNFTKMKDGGYIMRLSAQDITNEEASESLYPLGCPHSTVSVPRSPPTR